MSEPVTQEMLFNLDPAPLPLTESAVTKHESPPAEKKTLRRKYLINKLNYLNFSGQSLDAVFRHTLHDLQLRVAVLPQPCSGKALDCVWENPEETPPAEYRLEYFSFLEEGQEISFDPVTVNIGDSGITAELPGTANYTSASRPIRYTPAAGMDSKIQQNGFRFTVALLDYSYDDFHIRIAPEEEHRSQLINPEIPLWLNNERDGELVYSVECRILSSGRYSGDRDLHLVPVAGNIPRFPAKEYRSSRHRIELAPVVEFIHPISGVPSNFKVIDLSGTGFSVNEPVHDSRLLPGLIVEKAEMVFSDRKRISFDMQIISRNVSDNQEYVSCGVALVDISPEDHLAILGLLHQDMHEDAFLNSNLDIDALWRFFFDSGFIYPEKYQHFHSDRAHLRSTYEKLYNSNSNVARHFVVQKDNSIYGHLSMVRFYEKTWLIHHHASALSGGKKAGLQVLQQVGSYVNESYRFEGMNLRFLMCYFRPENRFPNKVFGGLRPFVENPQECSVDAMALLHLGSAESRGTLLPMISLDEMNRDDFLLLDAFYADHSGGMMLEAMGLPPYGVSGRGNGSLQDAYRTLGIERSMSVRAVRKNGRLIAVMILNQADPGINLSELTNSITFLVIDRENLSAETVQQLYHQVADIFSIKSVPVLMYPRSAADTIGISVDRDYHLWIMRMTITDKYFRHLNGFIRNIES